MNDVILKNGEADAPITYAEYVERMKKGGKDEISTVKNDAGASDANQGDKPNDAGV